MEKDTHEMEGFRFLSVKKWHLVHSCFSPHWEGILYDTAYESAACWTWSRVVLRQNLAHQRTSSFQSHLTEMVRQQVVSNNYSKKLQQSVFWKGYEKTICLERRNRNISPPGLTMRFQVLDHFSISCSLAVKIYCQWLPITQITAGCTHISRWTNDDGFKYKGKACRHGDMTSLWRINYVSRYVVAF